MNRQYGHTGRLIERLGLPGGSRGHRWLGLALLGIVATPTLAAAQIAAQYPNDAGIKNHPAVIYATGFESSDWVSRDLPSGTDVYYLGGSDQSARPQWTGSEAYTGTGALLHKQLAGTNLPHGMTLMGFPGVNEIYMRWYRKYQSGYRWGCQSAKNNGVYAVSSSDPAPEACVQPNGRDKFSFRVQDERRSSNNGEFYGALYSYHPDADNGGCGEWYAPNVGSIKYQQSGVWDAYEIYIKANTVGQRNGIIRMWVNGELRGEQTGLEFRLTDTLKLNQVYLYGSTGGCDTPYTQNVWDDNLVVATQYIGPMVRSSTAAPGAPSNVRIIR
jgi:hypothetical protein